MEIGKDGVVRLDFLGHAGFLITIGNGSAGNGKRIVIDPYNVSDNVAKESRADVILITHSHYDHCSIKDVEKLVDSEKGSVVICPADCQSKIMKIEGVQLEVVEVGDKIDLAGGSIKVEVIPAYNKYKDYHPKSEGWVGYVIKTGNVVVYHSGDSDFIPEMQKLSGYGKHGNEFIALLPVCGKQVMDAEEAADAASVISPDIAIPMKYEAGNIDNAKVFADLCKERNIRAELLEKI